MRAILILPLLAVAVPAAASTAASYAALDRATARACRSVSDLDNAKAGPVTRFSDTFGMDVRTVTGNWRPAHMKGAKATLLCIYDRRKKRAEVQELGR